MAGYLKLFNNPMTKSILGIDVGTNSIKAVEMLHENNSSKLIAYGDVYNSELRDQTPKNLHKNISKLLEHPIFGSFGSRTINISLPRYISRNHLAILDMSSTESIDKLVQRFITTKLNLNLKDCYFDYLPITDNTNSNLPQTYTVEIIDVGYFNKLNKLLSQNNIKIESINPTFARQLSEINDNSIDASVLIDIGHNTTKAFFCSKQNCIEKRIIFGGSDITRSIAVGLDITNQKALELQNDIGLVGSQLADKLRVITDSKLNDLASMIREFIDEGIDIFGVQDISNIDIKLTGTIMGVKGLAERLNQLTRLRIYSIDPWANASLYPLKPMPKYRLAKYAGAIALAH